MKPAAYGAAFSAKILIVSFAVGALAPFVQTGETPTLTNAAISGLSGLLIGAGCSSFEIYLLSNRSIRWLRKIPFLFIVVFRAIAYSAIIVLALVTPPFAILRERLWTQPYFLESLLFSAVIATAISFSLELGRLLGKEATMALFTGRYRRPRIEHRIVMFADLVGSTAIAERLGDFRFHQLLNDVSHDLSTPIEQHGGETHRYVGDAVIVTWPMSRKGAYDQSLSCAVGMIERLVEKSDEHAMRYGSPMQLRIAIHCGHVAAGEIGYWKKEIALLGDIMNTTARIEGAAREFNESTVVSDAVASQLSGDWQRMLKPLPDFQAAGKHDRLKLWALD